MPQKNLRKKGKGKPRAMPVEAIITRFKSAQKHQHELKEYKSNKAKVPHKSQTKPQNHTLPIENTIRHVVDEKANKSMDTLKDIQQNVEYYPQKLRRNLSNKKIVLVPKLTHKLVGSLNSFNKRKLRKPKKEIIYKDTDMVYHTMDEDDCSIFDNSKMSIVDNISIDSDSLDDEDLLEILTCPSPVWWEDPPDDYEESTSVKDSEDDECNTMRKLTNPNEIVKEQIEFNKKVIQNQKNELNKIYIQKRQIDFTSKELAMNTKKKDIDFVKRRNKLEELLGNLKDITVTKLEMLEDRKNHNRTNNRSPPHDRQKRLSESCDEELLDENFDDILRSFESIDIPIKSTSPDVKEKYDKDTTSIVHSKSTMKELKFVNNSSPLTNSTPVKGIKIIKSDIRNFKPNPNKVGKGITIKKNNMLIIKKFSDYCDMKIVKKNDKNIVLSKSERNTSSNNTNKPVTGITIGNWDQQLMRPGNKNLVPKINKKINLNTKKDELIIKTSDELGTCSNNKKSEDPSLDHVTVYQIISEQEVNSGKSHVDPKQDLNNEYSSQLSSYYNQRKNISKNIKDTNVRNKIVNNSSDVNSASVKSISVSDSETVQYCLQCSSIFNTDTCKYCATKHQNDTAVSCSSCTKEN